MAEAPETRQRRRGWISTAASVGLHAAAFLLIGAGQAGVPAGVEGGRVYALTYLGAVPGQSVAGAEAEASAVRQVARPPVEAKPRLGTDPKPAASVKKGGAATREKASGQVLVSPRGAEPAPLEPKAGREGATPEPDEAGEEESGTASALPAAGGVSGEGTAPAAPPLGSGMVAGLPRLVYPKNAENDPAKVRGTVVLRVSVDRDGHPVKVEVARSSGWDVLDNHARRAIERDLKLNRWVNPYVISVEVRFLGREPEVRVSDEPVEVGGA